MAFLEVAQAAGIKAWKSTSNYAEAERAISRYLAALALADHDSLDGMRDPVWSRRKLNGGGDTLHFSENTVSIETAREPLDWADGVWLTSLQIFRDGMAVARFDDWDNAKAAIMLLFFVRGKWRVASEISATAEHGDNSAELQLETPEREILHTLARFYDAVGTRSSSDLAAITDENWHVKHRDGRDRLIAEDVRGFASRISREPPRLHMDNSRVADVQVLHNRLACVRIDTPRLAQTTIFLLCRRGSDWVIAEKASSARISNIIEQRLAG